MAKKIRQGAYLFFLTFFGFLLASHCSAASIGISPDRVEFDLSKNQTERSISIFNPGDTPVYISYHEDDLVELILPDDAIPPHSSLKVKLKLKEMPNRHEEGFLRLFTRLSDRSGFSLSTGLMISYTVIPKRSTRHLLSSKREYEIDELRGFENKLFRKDAGEIKLSRNAKGLMVSCAVVLLGIAAFGIIRLKKFLLD